jgi:predicted metal-dependent phosphoesterase TrpH
MTLNGIIHFHTHHSYDSLTSIESVARVAQRARLDFLLLTDHDTVAGSVALRSRVAQLGLATQVPIAAEYNTSLGDVIAVFIEREIRAREFDEFVSEVREQKGLLLLPHPYAHHREVERVGAACDLIEVWNPRVGDDGNRRAVELARSLGKPTYEGADAHFAWGLADNIVAVEDAGDLRSSLLQGARRVGRRRKTPWAEVVASQYVKAAKHRDAELLLRLTQQVVVTGLVRRKLFTRL